MSVSYEVGLFANEAGALRLVGISSDAALVLRAREQIAAERRRELSELEPAGEPDQRPKIERH